MTSRAAQLCGESPAMPPRWRKKETLWAPRVLGVCSGAVAHLAVAASLLVAAAAFAEEARDRVEPDATFDDWFRSQEEISPKSFAAFMYSNTTHPAPFRGPPCPSLLSVRHVKTSTIDQFDEIPYYLEWSAAVGYVALDSLS